MNSARPARHEQLHGQPVRLPRRRCCIAGSAIASRCGADSTSPASSSTFTTAPGGRPTRSPASSAPTACSPPARARRAGRDVGGRLDLGASGGPTSALRQVASTRQEYFAASRLPGVSHPDDQPWCALLRYFWSCMSRAATQSPTSTRSIPPERSRKTCIRSRMDARRTGWSRSATQCTRPIATIGNRGLASSGM